MQAYRSCPMLSSVGSFQDLPVASGKYFVEHNHLDVHWWGLVFAQCDIWHLGLGLEEILFFIRFSSSELILELLDSTRNGFLSFAEHFHPFIIDIVLITFFNSTSEVNKWTFAFREQHLANFISFIIPFEIENNGCIWLGEIF